MRARGPFFYFNFIAVTEMGQGGHNADGIKGNLSAYFKILLFPLRILANTISCKNAPNGIQGHIPSTAVY